MWFRGGRRKAPSRVIVIIIICIYIVIDVNPFACAIACISSLILQCSLTNSPNMPARVIPRIFETVWCGAQTNAGEPPQAKHLLGAAGKPKCKF